MTEEETDTATENADAEEATETPTDEAIEAEAEPEEQDAEDEHAEPEPKKVDEQELAERSYRQRELKRLRRQNAQLTKAIEEQSKAVAKVSDQGKPPKIEDFETIDEYLDARDVHRDKQREVKPESSDYNPDLDDLYMNGAAKHEDFEDIVGNAQNITAPMADAIFEMDDPDLQVDVSYFLGTNPKEAMRISRLSPVRQIGEIARLEAKLGQKPAPQKRTSKAPAPIKPVGGKKTSNDEIGDTEDYQVFLRKRNKQLGR